MFRTAIMVFAGVVLCATTACSGDDSGSQDVESKQPTNHNGWPASDNGHTQGDGYGWPRWHNPCPGPACDPSRNHPEWLIDPPPDKVEQPSEKVMDPSQHTAPENESQAQPATR